jgi:hypothetical protein
METLGGVGDGTLGTETRCGVDTINLIIMEPAVSQEPTVHTPMRGREITMVEDQLVLIFAPQGTILTVEEVSL